MKKTLLLLASAAMLLVGCAKEQLSNGVDGGMTNVTFTASLDGGVATKADIDNDGKGTYVNRCIMEIYFQDQLYKRMVVPTTDKIATFANVPVVAGKQYQILFWADCGGAEKADKYYTTTNLKAVTVAKGAFIGALQNKENDKLDAFFGAEDYTVTPSYHSFDITLKRPFAQLNVITTDVAAGKTVTSADLLPDKVSVSYEADNILNVATGETSRSETETDYTFAYEAPVYGAWSTVASNHELTLSMDYILAPATEQGAVDVTFKTKNGETVVMNHSLANLPYKRNYRTNVKGDLLTVGGTWTATIDADWLTPDIVKVVEVADIQSANEIIEQYASTTKQLEVKFTAEPNDSGEPTGEATSAAKAIVTTPIKANNTLSIEVLAETKKLYIGDYPNEYTVTSVDTENAEHAIVNVNVPKSSKIETLYINAPTKSVYINGKEVANVGTITNLDAITSPSTLIIEKDQTVTNLTVHQGGLEIHGTVGTLVISENDHDNNPVLVRTSENLSQEVFEVIYEEGEGGHDYIDRPNFSEKQNANGTWDIVPSVCKIGEIGYGSLADAVAKVQEGQTITLVKDIENAAGIAINTGKTFTIDFNNHKYIVNKPGAGSTSTETAAFQLLKGQTITFKNGTIEAAEDNLTAAFAPAKNIKRMFQSYANVTFEGMIIDGTNLYENNSVCEFACGAVDIKGTTSITTGKQGVAVINVDTWKDYYPEGAQVTISSTGEFGDIYLYAEETAAQYTKSSLAITNGKISKVYGDDSGDWTATITGGLFSEKPADALVEEYFQAVENTDAATKAQYPWTVDRKHVAMIGSTKYYTLAEAVAAVPTSGTQTTITMIADHEILGNDGVTIAKTQNVILDLAGYTIKNLVNENKGSQVIRNDGELKIIGDGLITNSAAEGTQTGEWWSDPQYNYATNVITNNGDLTIDGANLLETANTSICYAIDNNSSGSDATCTIKSGHISTLASTAIRMFCNSTTKMNTINVEGGLIEGGYTGIWLQLPGSSPEKKKAKLNISGGTLKGGTYAWYDYTYGDLFDEVKVTISGGLLDGGIFSYGANIEISGGVFKSNVTIKENSATTASISGGKFDADIYASQTVWRKIISGGVFKILVDSGNTYCYWFKEICEDKGAYYLHETDPAYAEGYRYIVQ